MIIIEQIFTNRKSFFSKKRFIEASIMLDIKISKSNLNRVSFIYKLAGAKDNDMLPLVIENFTQPLNAAKYGNYSDYDLVFMEGIIWGIQYAMNSFLSTQTEKYYVEIQLLNLGRTIGTSNHLLSYVVIRSLFRFLNYTPFNNISLLKGQVNDDPIIFFPEAVYPPPIGHKSKIWWQLSGMSEETVNGEISMIEKKSRTYFQLYCQKV